MVFRPKLGLAFLLHTCVLGGGIFGPAVCPGNTWVAMGRKRAACATDARRRLPLRRRAESRRQSVVPVRRSQRPGRRKLPLRQLTGDLRAAVHELAGQSGAPWRPLIAEEVEPSAVWRYAHQAGREVHRPPPHPTATPNFIIAPALRLQLLHSHRLGRPHGCRPRPKSTQRRTGDGGPGQGAAPPTIQAACGLAPVRRRSPWVVELFRLRADPGRAQRRPGFRWPPAPVL